MYQVYKYKESYDRFIDLKHQLLLLIVDDAIVLDQ